MTDPTIFQHVEYIFFDLDDTLFPFTVKSKEARKLAYEAMIEKDLLPQSKRDKVDELYEILEKSAQDYTINERFLFWYFLNRCEHELGIKLLAAKKAILAAAGFLAYDRYMDANLIAYSLTKQALGDLKKKGYKFGLITNGDGLYQAYKIVRLRLEELIPTKHIFISDEIGARKPNPEIFQLVCRLLKINPKNCCYVGDDYDKDIIPAHKAGFKTVHCCHDDKPKTKAYKETDPSAPNLVVRNIMDLAEFLPPTSKRVKR